MHHDLRLWTRGDLTHLNLTDGLCELPPDFGRGLDAQALVLLGDSASLVRQRGVVALRPGEREVAGEVALEWRPRSLGGVPARCRWPQTTSSPAVPCVFEAEPTEGHRARAPKRGAVLHAASGAGQALPEHITLVGRHPACHVRLGSLDVSWLHCALLVGGAGVRVVDLGSTNGTRVDGVLLRDALVQQAARLSCGSQTLDLRFAGELGDDVELPSPPMRRVYEVLDRVAHSSAPVLLLGESGTGKDVLARRLHRASGRTGPWVAINTAALSATLAQSELFGHTRGAFTGATDDRDGAFAQAHGGTLLLDELGEMAGTVQAELLRAVETGRVRRIGDVAERPVDTRLVAATHRDLAARVAQGHFREDLYHRLCVVPIHVPALRERPEDLECLTRAVLERDGRTLSPEAWERLRGHRWPGNIRELVNTLRRAMILSDRDPLRASDLELLAYPSKPGSLDELIHEAVLATYDATGRSLVETARRLGLQRATVSRHVRLHQPAKARARAAKS